MGQIYIIYGTFKDFILNIGMPGPKLYASIFDTRSLYHLTNFTVYIVLARLEENVSAKFDVKWTETPAD